MQYSNSEKLEAIREAMLAEGFKQSADPDQFDTDGVLAVHGQFYMHDVGLDGEASPGKRWTDNRWSCHVTFAWTPKRSASGDPDRGRFELADKVAEILERLGSDTVLASDELTVSGGRSTWVDLSPAGERSAGTGVWTTTLRISFLNRRTYA